MSSEDYTSDTTEGSKNRLKRKKNDKKKRVNIWLYFG